MLPGILAHVLAKGGCLMSSCKTGFSVILNEVKDLNFRKYEILRFAQNDNCCQ